MKRIDYEALAEQMDQDNSVPVLSSVGRFLGRPGNVIRAILAGDPLAAAKNVGQFALDLPTGGFLDPGLSLANLIPGTRGGDITDRHERYTTEGVLRRWGAPSPTTGAGKFLVGLGGDVLTDPLTYLTFGGGGLAKGALAGVARATAAERLGSALLGTSAGRNLLKGVAAADRPAALEQIFKLGANGLERMTPEAEAALASQAVKRGLSIDPSALRFTGGEKALVPNFWRKAGDLTAPGLALKLGRKVAPEATEAVAQGVAKAASWTSKNLYDKTRVGQADSRLQALNQVAQQQAGKQHWTWTKLIAPKLAATAGDDVLMDVGKRMHLASDDFMARAYWRPEAERKAIAGEILAKAQEGLTPEGKQVLEQTMAAFGQASKELKDAGVLVKGKHILDVDLGEVAAMRSQAEKRLDDAMRSGEAGAIKAAREARDEVYEDVDAYYRAAEALHAAKPANVEKAKALVGAAEAKLARRQISLEIDNPFWIYRQLKDEAGAQTQRGTKVSRATKSRDYGTSRDWVESVGAQESKNPGKSVAQSMGLQGPVAPTVEELAETNVAKLALRYGDKHAGRMGKATLRKEAEAAGIDLRPGEAADDYIEAVWEDAPRPAATRFLAAWNKVFKPAATVIWPGYHFRNALGAIFQTALDPDMTLVDGIRAALATITNVPAINSAKKLNVASGDAVALMRAANGDAAAVEALKGMTIAGRPGSEVLDALVGSVISHAGGEADVFESVSNATRLGRARPQLRNAGAKIPLEAYQRYQDLAYKLANYTENSFRTHGYLTLLGKGVEPVEAAQRVNKIYLNYNVQSQADRVLRDLFPFIRFPLAIVPPTVEAVARRPGALVPQLVRQADTQAQNEDPEARLALPEGLRRSLRLPLGEGSYLSAGGILPHESVAQTLEALPTPGRGFQGAMKFAAGLSPPLKLGLEAVTNRNLFTGGEFASDRSAPGFLPSSLPGVRTFRTKGGETYKEIPAWANELLRALPTSRFTNTVESIVEDEAPTLDKIAKHALGLSVVRPGQRRGVARGLARYLQQEAGRGNVGRSQSFWARIAEGEELPEGLVEAIKAEASLKRSK